MGIKAESGLSSVFPLSSRESGKKVIIFRKPGVEDRGLAEVSGKGSKVRERAYRIIGAAMEIQSADYVEYYPQITQITRIKIERD